MKKRQFYVSEETEVRVFRFLGNSIERLTDQNVLLFDILSKDMEPNTFPGKTYPYDELLKALWGGDKVSISTFHQAFSSLRGRLSGTSYSVEQVKGRRESGYRLVKR